MKIVLFAPSDEYLLNFRGGLADAMIAAGHEVLMVAPPGPSADDFLRRGFRWIPAPMERAGMNPFKELRSILWLVRLFRRERVDLVHGFIIKGAVYGALAGRLARVPARVGSITGLGYHFLNQSPSSWLVRQVLKVLFRLAFSGNAVRVVLQCREDFELFREKRFARQDRLRLIFGSGVDCRKFSPPDQGASAETSAAASSDGDRRFRVLMPARLLWHKGLREYLDAAAIVKEKGLPIDFLLAGEPDPANPSAVSSAEIEEWVSKGVIQYLGYVTDMPQLLHTVDVVALPSYREAPSKALVEGAACGLPLITTDVAGCRDVVDNGVEGVLIPARSADALAEAVVMLYNNPEKRRAMGRAGVEKARRMFSSDVVIGQTLAVYGELIEGFSDSPQEVGPVPNS